MPSTPTIPHNGILITEQQSIHRAQKPGGTTGPVRTTPRIRYRGRASKSLKRLIEHVKSVKGRSLLPSEKAACIVLCTPWTREARN